MFQGYSANCFYRNLIQTDFDRAMRRLHDMDLVCFADDMDDCVAHLRGMLRLPAASPPPSSMPPPRAALESNSSVVAQALQNKTLRQLVAAANNADIDLFNWARRNYKQPYNASPETPAVD
jgi:hypothetical protein